MSGVIISWKTAKALGILPKHYSNPIPLTKSPIVTEPLKEANINFTTSGNILQNQNTLIQAFPTVFDGKI